MPQRWAAEHELQQAHVPDMSKCVVVVEDDPNIRHLIEIVLRRQCPSIETFADGASAIERLQAG
jgi:CheY-like chemotaxis protein